MDRGAWWATVHGLQKVGHSWAHKAWYWLKEAEECGEITQWGVLALGNTPGSVSFRVAATVSPSPPTSLHQNKGQFSEGGGHARWRMKGVGRKGSGVCGHAGCMGRLPTIITGFATMPLAHCTIQTDSRLWARRQKLSFGNCLGIYGSFQYCPWQWVFFGKACPLAISKSTCLPSPVFPHSSVGKESTCKAGDLSSIPGSGRSPGEGIGHPLQYSGLENSMDLQFMGLQRVGPS